MDYAKSNVIDGVIIFNDFTKAFDSLELDFMLSKHFGSDKSFISWIKRLHKGIQSCVINSGLVSETFENSRGIRLGCPLSALLYVYRSKLWPID